MLRSLQAAARHQRDLSFCRGFTVEPEVRALLSKVKKHTMVSYPRLVSLYDQVVFCERNGIEGDLVECGTWKGGSVAVMAAANMRHGRQRRRLHLFDSFKDICEPDAKVDGAKAVAQMKAFTKGKYTEAKGRLKPVVGFYDSMGGAAKVSDCRQVIEGVVGYPRPFVVYHEGWFQETLPTAEIEKIAVLRLDGDWYASTKVCLDHLFDKVVPGGFVVIDDYACYDGCRKAVDEFLSNRKLRVYLHYVDPRARYFVKS